MPFPVVLRFASCHPRALSKIEMHALRAGGDLSHVQPASLSSFQAGFSVNDVFEGRPGWSKKVQKDLEEAALDNRESLALSAEARGQNKEARRIRKARPGPLFRPSAAGAIRECILTASADYFQQGTHQEQAVRAAAFVESGRAFFKEHFPGQIAHLRVDWDEATPHFHAVIVPWVETTTRSGAKKKSLQPSSNPLLKSYETAQEVAGQWFKSLSLDRGISRRQVLRLAKEAGVQPPPKRRHKTPSAYRADLQNRETIVDLSLLRALDLKATAMDEAAQIIEDDRASMSAQRLALAEQAKAVIRDAAQIGLAISSVTAAATQSHPAPVPYNAASQRLEAIQASKDRVAKERREGAAREAIKKAAIKAQRGKKRERER